MFTTQFKVLIGAIILGVGFITLGANQAAMQHEIVTLQKRPVTIIVPSETLTPTASPTATLVPVRRLPLVLSPTGAK